MHSKKKHPFHLVLPSPWPFVGAMGGFIAALGLVLFMHHQGAYILLIGLALILFTMGGWWYDVLKESAHKALYTPPVQQGLRMGVVLFILSEIMFFVSFFWAFFDVSLFPAGGIWPPKTIHPLDPFDFPYFNTLILLLSGTTLTWAHHALLLNQQKVVVTAIGFTALLGFLFTLIQGYEYAHAPFGFTDGIYSSTFYMATGFHGFHVIIGTLFLVTCWFRARLGQITPEGHVGFEAAVWYWHFVDVVWLFLFISIYWWGSGH